jgi:hypothetical protein
MTEYRTRRVVRRVRSHVPGTQPCGSDICFSVDSGQRVRARTRTAPESVPPKAILHHD